MSAPVEVSAPNWSSEWKCRPGLKMRPWVARNFREPDRVFLEIVLVYLWVL